MSLLIRIFLRVLAQTHCSIQITGTESLFSSVPLSGPHGTKSWKADTDQNIGWYPSLKELLCYLLMYIFMLTHLWLKLFIFVKIGHSGNRNSMSIKVCLTKGYLLVDGSGHHCYWSFFMLSKSVFHKEMKQVKPQKRRKLWQRVKCFRLL